MQPDIAQSFQQADFLPPKAGRIFLCAPETAEILSFQGDLAARPSPARDASTRNDSETPRISTGKRRGICSGTVLVHFVRFENLHDQHYWAAVRVFGRPDFLHRFWDRRALREIGEADIVVFARGDADQEFSPFNSNDEAYQ